MPTYPLSACASSVQCQRPELLAVQNEPGWPVNCTYSSSPACLLQQQQTSRAVFAVGHAADSFTLEVLPGYNLGDPFCSNSLAKCSMTHSSCQLIHMTRLQTNTLGVVCCTFEFFLLTRWLLSCVSTWVWRSLRRKHKWTWHEEHCCGRKAEVQT